MVNKLIKTLNSIMNYAITLCHNLLHLATHSGANPSHISYSVFPPH